MGSSACQFNDPRLVDMPWDGAEKPPKNHRMTFLDSLEVVAYNTLPRLLIPRMAFKALSFIPYLSRRECKVVMLVLFTFVVFTEIQTA